MSGTFSFWKSPPSSPPGQPIISTPSPDGTSDPDTSADSLRSIELSREAKFEKILSAPNLDLAALRRLSWHGVPRRLRPLVWQLLLGYLPTAQARRQETLTRKRKEYEGILERYLGKGVRRDEDIYHQISIDVPRTCPEELLFHRPLVRGALLRILYCWSIRRPASGYVQGINDLVTPIFSVLMTQSEGDGGEEDIVGRLATVEGDVFWCLSKLLDSIQDNYTFNQIGIHRQIARLREIVSRTDAPLVAHLDREGIDFMQFSFRWMNCLLLREFPLRLIERLWDTYLAEGEEGFFDFHIYVCAAFLCRFSEAIGEMEFQAPPTAAWSVKDVESLLSEAFILKSMFHESLIRARSSR